MTTLEQRCIVAFLILLCTEYSIECGSQFSFQILHPRHRQVLEHQQQRHDHQQSVVETSTIPSSVSTSETTTTTTVTTTTTTIVTTTTLSSTTSKETETFPCDNFICLLQNFELMKTENGYFVKKIQKSSSENHSENCVHFKCWLNKFRLTKQTFGFQFTDKSLLGLPAFSNDNDFSIFQTHNSEDSSTYDQVVFPSGTHQEVPEKDETTSTVYPTLNQNTNHSDLSEAALDDFFENYDYEEFDE